LFSIARNLAIDHLRKQQRAIGKASDVPGHEAGPNLPAPDFESPFFAAARSEDAKRIATALEALEPIYGKRFSCVSRKNCRSRKLPKSRRPISTVSSRIHRGLSMLQASLGGGADAP
jgi:DNA-directed RNA polymerase specialized sigma subunit, sigma24 homolog